ncbi:MAG: hypothetical protein AAFO02_05675 [Bacteroidota bacterium]
MGFWERLREWFGSRPTPDTSEASAAGRTRPEPNLAPIKIPATDGSTLPLPGNTGIDVFRLLFSNKDKYTTTMLNSISLSSDMRTLYLIDNGRAIAFDLTVPQGVLVGLLGDQLVVATAVSLPKPSDSPIDPGGPNVEGEVAGGGRRPVPTPELEKFTFKAGENSQYTLTYNEKNKVLTVIGLDDIIINLEVPDDEKECSDKVFPLNNKHIINIRWETDELQVLKLPTKH